MSQHQSKGRRTPLTLGQHHKTAGTGNSRSNTPTIAADGGAAAEVKAVRDVIGPKSAKENAMRLRQAAATAADADVIVIEDEQSNDAVANSAAAVAATADKKTREKAPRKETVVPAKPPTANTGRTDKPAQQPPAAATVAATVAAVVAESPRPKARENLAKEAEAREIAAALADCQAQDEAAAVAVPAAQPSTPEKTSANRRGTRAGPANSSHSNSPNATPAKAKAPPKPSSKPATPTKSAATAVNVNDVLASTDMDDVMESLQMDSDADALADDVPAPETAAAAVDPSSPAKPTADDDAQLSTGKILKFSQSPAAVAAADDTAAGAPRSRLSPYATRRRLSTEENLAAAAAANVNLSTVSERSNEYTVSPAVASTSSGTRPVGVPSSLRQISGRRSTRPLRELALQQAASTSSASTETYRRVRTELDDSISSMNVTIGSVHDHGADDLTAAAAASKGRKRAGAALGGSEPDLQTVGLLVAESPKKPRLDLSGFFGMMASPVTMLRNKFSRTSLLCSTPVKLNVDAAEEEEDEEEEDAGDVASGAAAEDGPADGADVDMLVEDDGAEVTSAQMGAETTDVEAEIAEAMQPADGAADDGASVQAAEIVVEAEQPEENGVEENGVQENGVHENGLPTKAKGSNCLIM